VPTFYVRLLGLPDFNHYSVTLAIISLVRVRIRPRFAAKPIRSSRSRTGHAHYLNATA